MAKRKKNTRMAEDTLAKEKKPEAKRTRLGFLLSLWAISLGLAAQLVLAVLVYPSLPGEIPSSWAGNLLRGDTVPSWFVFVLFPAAQLVMLAVAMFTHKDENGRHIMESGKAATLIVLSGLFTSLQASAFYLPL